MVLKKSTLLIYCWAFVIWELRALQGGTMPAACAELGPMMWAAAGGPTCVYNVLKGLEPTWKSWQVLPRVSTLFFKLLFPWRRGPEIHQFSRGVGAGDTLLVGFGDGGSAGRGRVCCLHILCEMYFQYLWFWRRGVAERRWHFREMQVWGCWGQL